MVRGFNKIVLDFEKLVAAVLPLNTDSSIERLLKAIGSMTAEQKITAAENSLNTYKSTLDL